MVFFDAQYKPNAISDIFVGNYEIVDIKRDK